MDAQENLYIHSFMQNCALSPGLLAILDVSNTQQWGQAYLNGFVSPMSRYMLAKTMFVQHGRDGYRVLMQLFSRTDESYTVIQNLRLGDDWLPVPRPLHLAEVLPGAPFLLSRPHDYSNGPMTPGRPVSIELYFNDMELCNVGDYIVQNGPHIEFHAHSAAWPKCSVCSGSGVAADDCFTIPAAPGLPRH